MQFSTLGHLQKIEMPPSVYTYTDDPPGTEGTSEWRTIEFDRDELGRVKEITYPLDDLTETFQYDALGNLTNRVDMGGRTNRYTYAPARRLTSITRPQRVFGELNAQ